MLCRLFTFAGLVLVLGNVNFVSSQRQLTVELGICVDRNILEHYEKKYGRAGAERKLQSEVVSTVNKANELTRKVEIPNHGGINLKLSRLAILKSGREADKIAYHAKRDEDYFYGVINKKEKYDNPCREELRKYSRKAFDVIVTITQSFTGRGGGWANMKSICRYDENGVLMNFGRKTDDSAVILAHEVAHTLGSHHDDTNGCYRNQGIMAPFVGHGFRHWSKCSKEQINNGILNWRGQVKRCLLN